MGCQERCFVWVYQHKARRRRLAFLYKYSYFSDPFPRGSSTIMGTGTSTSLLLTDFKDLPITAQERLRHEYEICLNDGMEEDEVFYSLERSLMDEIMARLQSLRVHSQQSSHPEGSTPEGESVGSHDSMSSLGQLSTANNTSRKQRSKSNKIPGRSRPGLFPPLPASSMSPSSSSSSIKPTTTTGQQRFWEGDYLNEIEEDASYLEDTINRRVNTIRSKNERLLQKKTAVLNSYHSGEPTHYNHNHNHNHNLNHNHTSDVQSIASNGSNYSISPLKPHLHPYDQGDLPSLIAECFVISLTLC